MNDKTSLVCYLCNYIVTYLRKIYIWCVSLICMQNSSRKSFSKLTWGVVIGSLGVFSYILNISPTKPHKNLERINTLENLTNAPFYNSTNNSFLDSTNNLESVAGNNRALTNTLVKSRFAKDNPQYVSHYNRLISDSNTLNVMQKFISDLANLGPNGRLAPWVKTTIDTQEIGMIRYTDHDDFEGKNPFGDFHVYIASKEISNMRVNREKGITKVKIYEVRKDPFGRAVNVTSAENSPLRNNLEYIDGDDPFEKVAREVVTSQGYNVDNLSPWMRNDWRANVISGTNIVATRSYGGKSQAPNPIPDISVTLVSSRDSLTNKNSVYSNAFCTSFMVLSDFYTNGNLKKPEVIQQIGNSKVVFTPDERYKGRIMTNYPTNDNGENQ